MMKLYIAVGVALTCFILYALDRKSKGEKIEWDIASKLSVFGGLLSGGVAYVASSPTTILEVASSTVPDIQVAQDIFVGTPTF
jgi:hypothetical protein